MADSQKTTVNITADWQRLERHAWEKFRPRLEAVRSLADVHALLADAPPVGSPSSPFFSNLAFFLVTFRPAPGTGPDELALYEPLLQRLAAAGDLDRRDAAVGLAVIRNAAV